jgi:hypothetical protein
MVSHGCMICNWVIAKAMEIALIVSNGSGSTGIAALQYRR